MTDFYQQLVDFRTEGRLLVLVTVVDGSGHVPLPPPGKMLVDASGVLAGTVGGGTLEHRAIAEAQQLLICGGTLLKDYLLDDERPGNTAEVTGMLCGGKVSLFFEVLAPAVRAYILGAGHIGQALAPLLAGLGLAPVLVDCREETSPDLLAGPDYTSLPALPGLAEGLLVIATHGHVGDQRVLAHLLRQDIRPIYVGMIASRRKWCTMAAALDEEFGPEVDLSWVHAPAGLNLGGRTPADIALAIAAEIQAVRHGTEDLKHLRIAPFPADKEGS